MIGLRRRSAAGKPLMGSSARRILIDVDCPLLAVKRRRPPAERVPVPDDPRAQPA